MNSPRLSTVLIATAFIAAGVGAMAYFIVQIIFHWSPAP